MSLRTVLSDRCPQHSTSQSVSHILSFDTTIPRPIMAAFSHSRPTLCIYTSTTVTTPYYWTPVSQSTVSSPSPSETNALQYTLSPSPAPAYSWQHYSTHSTERSPSLQYTAPLYRTPDPFPTTLPISTAMYNSWETTATTQRVSSTTSTSWIPLRQEIRSVEWDGWSPGTRAGFIAGIVGGFLLMIATVTFVFHRRKNKHREAAERRRSRDTEPGRHDSPFRGPAAGEAILRAWVLRELPIDGTTPMIRAAWQSLQTALQSLPPGEQPRTITDNGTPAPAAEISGRQHPVTMPATPGSRRNSRSPWSADEVYVLAVEMPFLEHERPARSVGANSAATGAPGGAREAPVMAERGASGTVGGREERPWELPGGGLNGLVSMRFLEAAG